MKRHSGPGVSTALAAVLAAMLVSPAAAGPIQVGQVQRACAIEARAATAVAGIEVKAMPAAPGDLPFIQVVNRRTGASVRLYHAPALREVARARAACFGGVLDQLPALIPDTPADMTWAPIVLTQDRGYIPPRTGAERRWITPDFHGTWDSDALRFLIQVMPHEETHGRQIALRATPLPRWFQEGHAEWVGLKATQAIRPDLVTAARRAHDEAGAALPEPHLGAWGGRKVKPEAIERQLSPADRERRLREPGWAPAGPFSFRPGDFVEDNDKNRVATPPRWRCSTAWNAAMDMRRCRPG